MKTTDNNVAKLAYTSPTVYVYGDIRKITETIHHTGADDQVGNNGHKSA